MTKQKQEQMAKKSKKDYRIANRNFLKQIASEEDTLELANGVLYKVITAGPGEGFSPQVSNVVSVQYRGTLMNGREIDSSLSNPVPTPFRLRDVIEGWQVALTKMKNGDKWQVFIPAEMGYGDRTSGDIPGGSALVFEIELVSFC